MISLFLNSFLIILLFTPFGLILSNKQNKNLDYYSSQLIYGLIILSFIGLLVNFFLPLSKNINTFLLFIPFILLLKNFKSYLNKNFFIFLCFATLLVFILILESNVYRPDAGLYHLPYISILNNEKIIVGLSNFHFRYGHISIVQYLSAISNNLIFKENGIVFAQALIAASVIINFCFKIYEYNRDKNYNFHFYYLISVLIFIIYKMNRYSEYGNDAPFNFLFFFLISEIILLNKKNVSNVCNCLILIMFVVLNKITLLMCAFFAIIILRKKIILDLFKVKRFYFLIFFTFLWFTKNIIVSGCMLYPVKSTCFDELMWTDLKTVMNVSNENEAWTKDWPTYSKSLTSKSDKISGDNYSKNFFWVSYWLQGHFIKILKILVPYIAFLFLVSVYIKFNSSNKQEKINRDYIYLLIILIFSSFFWFFKVPVFRYGYSYLICLMAFVFAFANFQNQINKNSIQKIFNLLLILCLTIFISKNILRIIKTDNEYNNYPWPKFYAMNEKNYPNGVTEIVLNNKKLYKPNPNGYCMISNSPCGNYGVKNNLDITMYKNYLIMYLK